MDPLLEPISADTPSGVDLSYESVYNDLAVLMEGTPENQFEPGSAKEPDWPTIRRMSEESLKRSKDLQIAVYFTVALARTDGMEGAARGLELIAGLVRQYWDTLFPNLDPDDKDPTQRVNILSQLSVEQGSFGDPIKFIGRLTAAPIFRVPGLAVTMDFLKDELAGGDAATPRLTEILAAADPKALEAGGAAVRRVAAAVHATDDFLIENLGRTAAPSFERLIKATDRGLRLIEGLTAKTPTAAPAAAPAAPAAETAAPVSAPARTFAAGPSIAGEVRSLDDVRKALSKIREYYAANEPASPVPLLLQRAEGLVGKNFLELLENLTPNGRSEFDVLLGPAPVGGND